MRDDEAEDGEKHEATTVPPPAGESDIYEAKTQVGGLPPEAMELLRQMREEIPSSNRGGHANVPVFVEDEPVASKPRPAAGMPAASRAVPPPPRLPQIDVPPVFTAPKPAAPAPFDSVPPLVPQAVVSAPAPLSYESVFAPLPPSTATPPQVGGALEAPPAPAPTNMTPLMIIGGVIVGVLLLVLLGQAGLIPGLHSVTPP